MPVTIDDLRSAAENEDQFKELLTARDQETVLKSVADHASARTKAETYAASLEKTKEDLLAEVKEWKSLAKGFSVPEGKSKVEAVRLALAAKDTNKEELEKRAQEIAGNLAPKLVETATEELNGRLKEREQKIAEYESKLEESKRRANAAVLRQHYFLAKHSDGAPKINEATEPWLIEKLGQFVHFEDENKPPKLAYTDDQGNRVPIILKDNGQGVKDLLVEMSSGKGNQPFNTNTAGFFISQKSGGGSFGSDLDIGSGKTALEAMSNTKKLDEYEKVRESYTKK